MHAFDVLGDPIRRRILELLARDEHAAGAVADIVCREFSVSQAAVSQHLKVLRDNGFATVRKDGVRRLYSVETRGLQEIDDWLDRFRHFWEPKLDALSTEIARGKKARRKETDG
jgi:DNA-binding transcriptional ArsR family regulator